MDAFSYLSVLLSVVLGLAIQQVLTGYRALLLARGRVIPYAPPLLWSVVVLAMVAQHWWASFGLSEYATWSFAAFATVLVQTALIYMLAALVLPDMPAEQPIDLKAHYWREVTPFYSTSISVILWSVAREYVLYRQPLAPLDLAFHILFLAMAAAAIVIRREWLHQGLAWTMGVAFAAYIVTLFARL